MIKIKIYDYENNAKEIELRDDLKLLVVRVISGDEVILAYYKDSTAADIAEIAEQYNKNISERIEKLNHKLEEL